MPYHIIIGCLPDCLHVLIMVALVIMCLIVFMQLRFFVFSHSHKKRLQNDRFSFVSIKGMYFINCKENLSIKQSQK